MVFPFYSAVKPQIRFVIVERMKEILKKSCFTKIGLALSFLGQATRTDKIGKLNRLEPCDL